MSSNDIFLLLTEIRHALQQASDQKSKESFQRFFKEPVLYYGVKTGLVRKIAQKYWAQVKDLDKTKICSLCESLLASDYCEEAFIVNAWLPRWLIKFEEHDLQIFGGWIEKYINNWAKCDGFCNHAIGDFLEKYPATIQVLKQWAQSNNRWVRRAAAVSLIVPAKRGKYLADVLAIADILLMDTDDLVRKGYGWLLKEASRLHKEEVLAYVIKRKVIMPRTALRYAIELMPKPDRLLAMQNLKIK